MTDLALSALTDVILACELFFLAGLSFRGDMERGSAAHLWALYLALTGLGTMLGAIDHAFFEPIAHPGNAAMKFATRAALAVATLTLLMATAQQFLSAFWRRVCLGIGLAGLAAIIAVIATHDDLLALVAANAAAMILLLVLSVRGLRSGTGSPVMCVGIAWTIAASMVIPFGGEGLPLGQYGALHVALMPAVLLLYLGGRSLNRARADGAAI